MPVPVGLIFLRRRFSAGALEQTVLRCKLERKRNDRAGLRRWLGAGCALALMCVLATPRASAFQASGSGGRASASSSRTSGKEPGTRGTPKASSTKTSNPKKPAKAASKRSAGKNSSAKTTASRRRTHPPSHLAADTQMFNTASTDPSSSTNKRANTHRTNTPRGQQKIDPERAQAIQEALIREHYLTGTAAGTWNQASEDAMRRYQAEHGWQSKTVPDSRALISLGLGPSHDHLLNPESAMTTGPTGPRAASLNPVSQSSAPRNATQSPVSHSADPGRPVTPAPASTSDHDAPR